MFGTSRAARVANQGCSHSVCRLNMRSALALLGRASRRGAGAATAAGAVPAAAQRPASACLHEQHASTSRPMSSWGASGLDVSLQSQQASADDAYLVRRLLSASEGGERSPLGIPHFTPHGAALIPHAAPSDVLDAVDGAQLSLLLEACVQRAMRPGAAQPAESTACTASSLDGPQDIIETLQMVGGVHAWLAAWPACEAACGTARCVHPCAPVAPAALPPPFRALRRRT